MVVRSWASYEPLIGNSQTEYVEWEPWLNYHVQHSKSDNQHYDYDFGGLFLEAESTYVVEGDRSIGRRGPNVHFESTYGEFRRYYEKSNQTLKIVSIINLPRQVIALEQLEEFNAFMQSIKEHAKLRFELLGVDG